MIASLSFSGGLWPWVALLTAPVVIALAWIAIRSGGLTQRPLAIALALRALGIALVLLCLLEPQWVAPRAKRGANIVAAVADNSQGLQITDTGAEASRGETLRAALTDIQAPWFSKLNEEFQLRSYLFDRTLRRVQDFSALDFQGDRSSLGKALKDTRERFAGQPLAGVLIFTDGNATDIAGMLPDLKGLPPVYPVVVGKANTTRDVRIDRVDVRQTPFDDSPVTLRAAVSGHRAGAADIEVALKPLGKTSSPTEPPETTMDNVPAPQSLRVPAGGGPVEVTFSWRPTNSGVQFYELSATPRNLTGPEATMLNNRRRVMIDRGREAYRVLYVGGRPNWEYKFLNRAVAADPQLQMVGLIRVARREPKFEFKGRAGEASNPLFRGFGRGEDETARYDQPVLVRISARDENELRGGFPATPEELFGYDAIIVDDLEASFFTHNQLELLRRFASERGGGLLFLGGADALENGGYVATPVAAALPVHLDRVTESPLLGELHWKLTREGWVEPWTRVRTAENEERERLAHMPGFRVLHALNSIKPGATTLATAEDQSGQLFPALVSQRYGAGRVACVTVGDLWRWALRGENEQADQARFWRQLTRWLVTDAPPPISLRVERADDGESVTLHAVVKNRAFQPVENANVALTIKRVDTPANTAAGPTFSTVTLSAEPVADRPGEYRATVSIRDAGAYTADADITSLDNQIAGRARAGWVNDPAAEEFASLDPNNALLEEIARQTGGEVLELSQLEQLAERLPKRSAPIMESRSWPIWQQSWVLLLVLGCFLAEWALRRARGLP